MRSFSRRLGYLHTSKDAQRIVIGWLAAEGPLGRVDQLNEIGQAMLHNVAPVAPEETLAALERVIIGANNVDAILVCTPHASLIRAIAYDSALFNRCLELLVRLEIAQPVDPKAESLEAFCSLFHVILSGTRASVEQRAERVNALLGSGDERRRALGIASLRAMLTTSHIWSSNEFQFGARPRDVGYRPANNQEAQRWFTVALQIAERAACDPVTRDAARQVLAGKFSDLWFGSNNQDELTLISRRLHRMEYWPEGWLAIRDILDLHGSEMPPESRVPLVALEKELRPTDLLQQLRMIARAEHHYGIHLEDVEEGSDDIGEKMARTEALTQELGRLLATNGPVRTQVLPELMSSKAQLWGLGEGLAAGSQHPAQLWQELVEAFTKVEPSARQGQPLRGFLCRLRVIDPAMTGGILEEAITHDTLAPWFPFLQTAVDLLEPDVERLKKALIFGKAPAKAYNILQYGRATAPVPAPDLRDILLLIAEMQDGYDVALEILYMRLHDDAKRLGTIAPELMDTGRQLLSRIPFSGKHQRVDHSSADIARHCLGGADGAALTKELCQRLKDATRTYQTNVIYHDDLLIGLFAVQPLAALDGLCGTTPEELREGVRVLRDGLLQRQPLAVVIDDDIIAWCDQDPLKRYTALADVVPFRTGSEKEAPRWTSIALEFFKKAPDPCEILRKFTARFTTGGVWTNTLVAYLESMAALFNQLDEYPTLQGIVAEQRQALAGWIDEAKKRDRAWQERDDERFE